MDTQRQGAHRKTGAEWERDGKIYGGLGLIAVLLGLAGDLPAIIAIGALVAVVGLVMFGAGITRRN